MSPQAASTSPQSLGLPWERGDRPALTGHWWARGLWLAERAGQGETPRLALDGDDDAVARAERRLQRWQHGYPALVEDAAKAQREALGLNTDQLRYLLAEDPVVLAARVGKPPWAYQTERIVSGMPGGEAEPVSNDGDWRAGFSAVWEPFIADALSRLTADPRFNASMPVVEASRVLQALRAGLTSHVLSVSSRILVLELNVARVTGRLEGDVAAQRFWSFIRQLRESSHLGALLDEYVVLARTVVTVCDQAVNAYAEFLGRYTKDRERLVAELFAGTDPGLLVDIQMGGGDAHDRGRTVGLLTFANGARAVYKPRPLGVHRHFNEVLVWFGDKLPAAALRALTVVDSGDYGWTEFVAPQPCADAEAADRYFFRLGALLCLLYGLAGVDFHYENLIAVGDQPVPVDLESIFHVELPAKSGNAFTDDDPAGWAVMRSVQRVGLLPALMTGEQGGVIDIGGMGADKDFPLPFKSPDFDEAGTDEMRLVRVQRLFPGSQNRPTLDGRDLDPADYEAALLTGFRAAYHTLLEHRGELIGEDGLLRAFAGAGSRIIVRATRVYATLLSETTHPDVGRDALDRDQVFGLLGALANSDPDRLSLMPHELADLWCNDVPLFKSFVDSRDLWATSGTHIEQVLAETGVQRAQATLEHFSPANLREQEWIIGATLATRSPVTRAGQASPMPSFEADDTSQRPLTERALEQARQIGDWLDSNAYRSGSRVGWLGLDLIAQEHWSVNPLRADLYNGYPGVALLLAQLAKVTGEQRYADLARTVVAPLNGYIDLVLSQSGPESAAAAVVGSALSGLVGAGYALDAVSVLLGEPELALPVQQILIAATEAIRGDQMFDIISGAAGTLAVAEGMVLRYGTAADQLARACATVLVDHATPVGHGVGWNTTMQAHQPLLGFSHGAGGIGWALLLHAARTNDSKAMATGYAAMEYERHEFREDIGNWPDHRDLPRKPWQQKPDPDAVPHMYAWCHGAPGIALSRAATPYSLRTPAMVDDMHRALAATMSAGHFGNHSLCHGDLGNLEALTIAVRAGYDQYAEHREQFAVQVLAQIEHGGPLCGTPGNAQTPGLLTGLSGVGHGLLRIAAPDAVAPILLLAKQN